MNAALVEVAVGAIVHWAGRVDRSDAEHWLGIWPRHDELSEEDYFAVLDQFGPERKLRAGRDFLPVMDGNESTGLYDRTAAMPGSPAVPADSYEREDAELDEVVVFDDADGYGIDGRAAKAGAL